METHPPVHRRLMQSLAVRWAAFLLAIIVLVLGVLGALAMLGGAGIRTVQVAFHMAVDAEDGSTSILSRQAAERWADADTPVPAEVPELFHVMFMQSDASTGIVAPVHRHRSQSLRVLHMSRPDDQESDRSPPLVQTNLRSGEPFRGSSVVSSEDEAWHKAFVATKDYLADERGLPRGMVFDELRDADGGERFGRRSHLPLGYLFHVAVLAALTWLFWPGGRMPERHRFGQD